MSAFRHLLRPRALAASAAGAVAYAAFSPPAPLRAKEPDHYAGAPAWAQPSVPSDPPQHSNGNNAVNKKISRARTIAEASEELQLARKRVAVFGGSFNPITNAHLNCAAEISAPNHHARFGLSLMPHAACVRACTPRSPLEAG